MLLLSLFLNKFFNKLRRLDNFKFSYGVSNSSKKYGKVIQKITLESPPKWDSMIVAYDKIYISLMNGKIICFSPIKSINEDRFFEKTKEYEIEKITCTIEDIKQKMPTLKFWISKKKRSIRKGVKRNLDKSLKSLDNVSAKIVIKDLDIAEIKDYIPTKFRPIATLFEEISSSIR